MKRLIKSYTNFTRPERNGLIGLCLLLAVVIAARVITAEPNSRVGEPRIAAAYRQQNDGFLKTTPKRKQPATNLEDAESPTTPSAQSEKSFKSAVQTFDPNTADSLTLRSFGLKPHTIANLLKWRAKGKRFYKKEDLKPLYTLTNEEYTMLAPHIAIRPLQIDLNTADSITLLQLRGIGPKLAHKIIVRRNTIGAFTNYAQLKELYHFPDGVFEGLVEELKPLSEPQINRDGTD
ncbi:helix-hairpin-helix domain-containing protein [Polluticoccus soli]|uniref:helix-hairpin-helix domain-containing protein n=1 Tax=Polluticoccus soli TaxID=3034150 RepID=UPI0023E0EED3|nr:helix-hairpin-helix domain-containing protein [Flavipsychrobacter sp. JY13-12]